MTDKHSPGPWTVGRPVFPHANNVYGADGRIIGGAHDWRSEAPWNAALMAAAPDLLAACRALLEVITDVPGYDPYGFADWCDAKAKAEEKARAAIAKATGGSDAG